MKENDINKFYDFEIGFCSIFKTEFNIYFFLSSFFSNSIFIFQLYFFSDMKDLQEKYYAFFMGYILYKLILFLSTYYQIYLSDKIIKFYLNRKYVEMNLFFNKCFIISIIINIITYFPFKYIFMYISINTYLTKQNSNFIDISIIKVNEFINIHFFVALFGSLTNSLSQIIYLLNNKKYV